MENILWLFISLGLLNGLSPIFAGVEIDILVNLKRQLNAIWFIFGAFLMNSIGAIAYYFGAYYFLNEFLKEVQIVNLRAKVVVDLVLGLILIVYAIVKLRNHIRKSAIDHRLRGITDRPISLFIEGFTLQLVAFPFSVILFVFITKVVNSKIPFVEGVLFVLAFCLLATLPLFIIMHLYKRYSTKIEELIEKINNLSHRLSRYVIPILCLIFGAYFIYEATIEIVNDMVS